MSTNDDFQKPKRDEYAKEEAETLVRIRGKIKELERLRTEKGLLNSTDDALKEL